MPNKPQSEFEKLAWDYAKEKHSNQVRKFLKLPYFDAHVQKVNGILKKYTQNQTLLVSSLLHDVIEDCFAEKWDGYEEVMSIFGKEVADIVLELTSDKREIKLKYGGSKSKYLAHKIITISSKSLTIKLADRLQNINDIFTADASFRENYFNETILILNSLQSRRLNSIQTILVSEIKSKLRNADSIFKITQKSTT